jgi:hypothetical protein
MHAPKFLRDLPDIGRGETNAFLARVVCPIGLGMSPLCYKIAVGASLNHMKGDSYV